MKMKIIRALVALFAIIGTVKIATAGELIHYGQLIGVFSEDNRIRLDIGIRGVKEEVPSNHNSWATRLKIMRLDGRSEGPVRSDHLVGIFSEDGRVRLDVGSRAMKEEIPASHESWATRLVIRRLNGSNSGPVHYGDVVGMFSEDGRVRLDVGSRAMKEEIPASHESWATKLRLKSVKKAASSYIPSGYFRLTSQFRELHNECLESNKAGNAPTHMDSCQNVTGQLWKAKANGDGYFKLTSQFREAHNECLEGNQAGNAPSHMDRCRNVTGQFWKATDAGGGYFKLTTQFREGHNECLESNQAGNGPAHMDSCKNVSGQLWKFLPSNLVQKLSEDTSVEKIADQLSSEGIANLSINFELNSHVLTPTALEVVGKLAEAISKSGLDGKTFEVQGHTDSTGNDSYNQTLSEKRAESVVDELVNNHNVDSSKLLSKGYGETVLFDPEDSESADNRRVEIHLTE